MFFKNITAGMVCFFIGVAVMAAGCSKPQAPPDTNSQAAPNDIDHPTQSPTPNHSGQINSVHAIDLPRPIAPAGLPLSNHTPGIALTPSATNVMASTPGLI